MITVHHLENSRSQRVLWLLDELALPYQVTRYQRDEKTMLGPPELRAVHALGKSPVITDGDTTLAETGAIVEYLLERHGQGRLRPAEHSEALLRYRYWLHFAEGSAMPPLLMALVFDRVANGPMPFFVRPVARAIAGRVMDLLVRPNLTSQFDFMEAELQRYPWFAGADFSAADIMMSFPLEAAARHAGLDESRPAMMKFLDRIHARPAYQKALKRGGPYDFVKPLTLAR